jgi:hypothetical protein
MIFIEKETGFIYELVLTNLVLHDCSIEYGESMFSVQNFILLSDVPDAIHPSMPKELFAEKFELVGLL